MAGRIPTVNMSADYEENLVQLAKFLGTDKIRRQIFEAVYGRGTRPKSKKQIMVAAGISNSKSQQVHNALDHLSKHHLIAKIENDGTVDDGSKLLYQKEESIRAIRKELVVLADNKTLRERVPTKRKPLGTVRKVVELRFVKSRDLKKKRKLVVLYLTANPNGDLRIDSEVKRVQEEVRGSAFRENIEIHYRPAADLNSLIHGLNDLRPNIVHFSGHGNKDGIAIDAKRGSNNFVSFDLLAAALKSVDSPPDVVVLNSCESVGAKSKLIPPAKAILIMSETVSDVAATNFAVHFYGAVASGQSLKSAWSQGVTAVQYTSLKEVDTPQIVTGAGVDPSKLVLT